ncbi:hypothetical protein Ahy_A02g006961 [Arachis hypogaea]|uniref:DUF4283 domain-containing protein n=1 Tax=Arachis hypogaea TaxID=3818 RepID=A0A445EBE8_ARAHY|nr:hypothetical protein Ahy_A02g006961 [Arachis hypogaea]
MVLSMILIWTIDIDMDRDYFLVHFSDDEGCSHALMEGPWMIVGHYPSSKDGDLSSSHQKTLFERLLFGFVYLTCPLSFIINAFCGGWDQPLVICSKSIVRLLYTQEKNSLEYV